MNKINYEGFQPDSVVRRVNEKFVSRAEVGYNKDNATKDRDDLTTEEWIDHAME